MGKNNRASPQEEQSQTYKIDDNTNKKKTVLRRIQNVNKTAVTYLCRCREVWGTSTKQYLFSVSCTRQLKIKNHHPFPLAHLVFFLSEHSVENSCPLTEVPGCCFLCPSGQVLTDSPCDILPLRFLDLLCLWLVVFCFQMRYIVAWCPSCSHLP